MKPKPEEKIEKKEINIEELQKKSEHIELDETKNRLLRALADFENYKKRVQNEKEALAKFANETLILDMLPILDNFGRALAEAEKQGGPASPLAQQGGHEEIIKGLLLVEKQMEDALKKFGVCEVEAEGKMFDPHFHEAIQKIESDKPENTIIEVMQKGYTLNGRLIRPAMVIISKGGK
ncbi:nucleotide exchange factor GrpE [candidate division WOR-1 bacterium RIFOXYA12_FULL_43_27]|uniref:Protein GrpE n=1 Tax=candidate division WOR-1 bacterium RIFOXYC2_FULL_46_14 TaxID=1802587 RepID=A0A1F4U8J3_UNCSA|nr:MAG: nucleotide exchange factor GrpE [candidate division WOR-1 bacterium RIFOXYA12_FULL_43_27]OGC19548.1 MAG: nucleotide exchange factor GrpE [candidate division WOR-1 bacterium RIFOXYB2_FULL_46_45]OGC30536.1 MAG: nucleotide exchange factor GrpE [candidate division WOR-1 bacterium RIFOXYA2_FULL_46_56]OGC40603.1 MAG: nucleotide exchange factor GrpE [candidate division WOR-1 bacterium RIFOXYC2_FULL_46_14]